MVISASEGEFGSVKEACRAFREKDMYVLGGQNIYEESLCDPWIRSHCQVVVLLTHLWNETSDGDRFFPYDAMITSTTRHEDISPSIGEWLGIPETQIPHSYRFMLYV